MINEIKKKFNIKWKVPAKWTMFASPLKLVLTGLPRKKKLLSGALVIGVVIVTVGSVAALNGWFGGGNSIPEDTMTRGLVGYWGFEEGSGTVAHDASNYANNGTLNYMTTGTDAWATGKVGGALNFDGIDDYVAVGNVGSVQTIEFWLNDSNAADGILELIDNANYISISSSAISLTGFTNSTTYINGTVIATLASGWNHVVVTADAISAASFKIGEANDDYLSGKIDEVRIYNRALSDAEVRYHYNRGGPVAQWKFDEGSGSTVYDSTENNNDGTMYYMSTSTGGGWANGQFGTALSFDGVDDYVSLGNNIVGDLGDQHTLEAWVKANNTGLSQIVLSEYESGVCADSYFAIRYDNVPFFHDGASDFTIGTTNVADNKWHHIVFVSDISNSYIYVDGRIDVVSEDIGWRNTCSNTDTRIGSLVDESWFNGLIDDVRIYDYARTLEEIRLDYNAGFAAKFGYTNAGCQRDPASCMTQGLVGYWSFDEGSGSTAHDDSGLVKHGQLETAAPSSWSCGDTLTDADSQTYGTVLIGSQCWMAENLNVTTTAAAKGDCSGYGYKYCYNDTSSNCDTYGGLYQWNTMMCGESSSNAEPSGVQGICPSGWHIPSHYEFSTLEQQVCTDIGNNATSGTCADKFPKDIVTTGYRGQDTTTAEGEGSAMAGNEPLWTNGDIDHNGLGDNDFGSSGLNMLPAGYRFTAGSYYNQSVYALLWSAFQSDASLAWRRNLYYTHTDVYRNFNDKAFGYAVRCVRD